MNIAILFQNNNDYWYYNIAFQKELSLCYFVTYILLQKRISWKTPEYTRGIGHWDHKIYIRNSLTILCHCHYNEGTAACQENKHKPRFVLIQTSSSTAKITIYCQKLFNIFIFNKCSKYLQNFEISAIWINWVTSQIFCLPIFINSDCSKGM